MDDALDKVLHDALAIELGGYWLYWAELLGKRAAAMLGCCHAVVCVMRGYGLGLV